VVVSTSTRLWWCRHQRDYGGVGVDVNATVVVSTSRRSGSRVDAETQPWWCRCRV